MLTYTIRLGRTEDLARLAQIEWAAASLFPEADLPAGDAQPASPDELVGSINAGHLWVIEDADAAAVGFVACERIDECLHILEMDVLPEHGRRGLGTALLEHVIAWAAGQPDLQTLTLTTFAHLPWNAPFYARHGFAVLAGGGGIAHLRQALAAEAARGLANRVAMTRRVSQ